MPKSPLTDILPEITEISKRVSERTALMNEEHIFTVDYVAKNSHDICWLKSESGKMLMISPRYTRHLGISKKEYVGKYDSEVFPKYGKEHADHDRIIRENHPMSVFVWESWVNASGQEERGLVLKKSQLLEGRITTFGLILTDTVEVVNNEKQQSAADQPTRKH